MLCPYLKRAGSTVVEYFEWDLPKVLSQGIAELLKDADNRRFSAEPDGSSPTEMMIAKGSSQDLVRSRTQGY